MKCNGSSVTWEKKNQLVLHIASAGEKSDMILLIIILEWKKRSQGIAERGIEACGVTCTMASGAAE